MEETFETSLVSANWLKDNLERDDIRILDVTRHIDFQPGRDPLMRSGLPEWQQGHIPRSIYIDLTEELSDLTSPYPTMLPDPDYFAQTVGGRGIGDAHHLVVYSAGNIWWATRAWWMFRTMGFDKVSVLDGGFQAWKKAMGLVSTDGARYPAATFSTKFKPQNVADKTSVQQALASGDAVVVNALWADHHSGEKDYGYARRGRISGSRNIPHNDLVDPDSGCFLTREELRCRVDKVLPNGDKPVIFYCGGGIAATMGAFVLHLLGRETVSVYDASLREWAADESLPMETD